MTPIYVSAHAHHAQDHTLNWNRSRHEQSAGPDPRKYTIAHEAGHAVVAWAIWRESGEPTTRPWSEIEVGDLGGDLLGEIRGLVLWEDYLDEAIAVAGRLAECMARGENTLDLDPLIRRHWAHDWLHQRDFSPLIDARGRCRRSALRSALMLARDLIWQHPREWEHLQALLRASGKVTWTDGLLTPVQ